MREPIAVKGGITSSGEAGPAIKRSAAARPRAADKRPAAKAKQKQKQKPRRKKVPGGKALARIKFFLIQRGDTEQVDSTEASSTRQSIQLLRKHSSGRGESAEKLIAGRTAARQQATRAAAGAGRLAPATPVTQSWQPLGPFYIPHGQTYGSGRGSRPPVAGRVSSIAIDPDDEQHILCGAAGGGVWETSDGGRTWEARTDDQPSLSIGAIAYDPSNPERVYVGTGEGDTAPSRNKSVRAAGILSSDDRGTTWSVFESTTFLGISFYDLLVDPLDSDHILAATTNGLYETTDGGSNWTRRRTALTWKLSMHPQVATNPAAGREVLAACEDGIFRSTNAGTSWTKVTLPGLPATFAAERFSVAHCASNGSVVYVSSAGPPMVPDPDGPDPMPKPYLWRRSTFGGAFSAVTVPPRLQTGQAWYDWFLAVAPNNPDVVYVGGINVHRGTRQSTGVWNWVDISAKGPAGDSIHPDQHTIAFSPQNANVVYIGNDGGIYRSRDAGITWETLTKGLSITEVEFLAQHPDYDAWILAGLQDNGTIRYEGQQTWYHVQDGDGGDCGVNREDPYTCYHSFYGPSIERSKTGGHWNSWSTSLNIDEESHFYPPLDVDGKLVVRGATRVWVSRDSGTTWKAFNLPSQSGMPTALSIASADRIFAGNDTGQCYMLERSTANDWTVTKKTKPANGYMSDLVAEPGSTDRLWCTVNIGGQGSVFRSTDSGTTWTELNTGIPDGIAIHAIEIDPRDADRNSLFIGTDIGVFRTLDRGQHWTAFGRGLPNVLVKDLLLHAPTGLLRAGTQARGVWEIELDAATIPDVHIYIRDHAADTGRKLPSDSDVSNPFEKGAKLFWWQSPDIKVDASPFLVPTLDDLDFDLYSDDRSKREGNIEFATGLQNDQPVRGQTVRVYVQAHNRGTKPATDVSVRAYFTAANLTWPDLPANFWQNFPNNTLPVNAAWQAVAPAKTIERIESGRSEVVGFDWAVPNSLSNVVSLLAIISAENDSAAESSLNISDLVRNSRYCALRNLAVVNPSPLAGPELNAILVDVPADGQPNAQLSFDSNGMVFVRGVVLPKSQVAAAKKAGWRILKLTKADLEDLGQVTDAHPELKKQLNLKMAYRPNGTQIPFGTTKSRSMILLIDPKARRGSGSVVLRTADDVPLGGLTLMKLVGGK